MADPAATPPLELTPPSAAPPNAAEIAAPPGENGMAPPAPDDRVRGEGSANDMYQGQRLNYAQEIEDLDPLNVGYIKEMVRAFVVFSSAAWMGLIIAIPLFVVLAIGGGQGAANALAILFFLGIVALWVVFLFRPIPMPVAEWKFMVDDRAAADATAFEHIAWALKRRRSPVGSLRVRRLSQPGQRSRDYLQVRDGIFTSYISCFAYGGDLFVGWTFWWSISPFRWFLIAIGRVWQTLTMRASQIHLIARYENGKAMREAIHAASREGVDVATGTVAAQGAGTIGSEIPVELVSVAANLGFAARAEAGQPVA